MKAVIKCLERTVRARPRGARKDLNSFICNLLWRKRFSSSFNPLDHLEKAAKLNRDYKERIGAHIAAFPERPLDAGASRQIETALFHWETVACRSQLIIRFHFPR